MSPRRLLSAAVMILAVTVSSNSASAGLFSHDDSLDCAPTCAVPIDNCVQAPTCCAPSVAQVPSCYAPSACAPVYPVVGPACAVPCEGYYGNYVEVGCGETEPCERKCGLRQFFCKLMDLERRKNNCLKETFLGWRDDDCDDYYEDCGEVDCAPLYYYEPGCAVPGYAVPYGY